MKTSIFYFPVLIFTGLFVTEKNVSSFTLFIGSQKALINNSILIQYISFALDLNFELKGLLSNLWIELLIDSTILPDFVMVLIRKSVCALLPSIISDNDLKF